MMRRLPKISLMLVLLLILFVSSSIYAQRNTDIEITPDGKIGITHDGAWEFLVRETGILEAVAPDNTVLTLWYDQALWEELGVPDANTPQNAIQNYLNANQSTLVTGIENHLAFGGQSYLSVSIRGAEFDSGEILVFAFELNGDIFWGLSESLDGDEGQRDRDTSTLIGNIIIDPQIDDDAPFVTDDSKWLITLDSDWEIESVESGVLQVNAPDNTRIMFLYDRDVWVDYDVDNAESFTNTRAVIQAYLDTNRATLISGIDNYLAFGGRSYLAVGIRGDDFESPEKLIFAFELDGEILWGIAESMDGDEGQRDRDASTLVGNIVINPELATQVEVDEPDVDDRPFITEDGQWLMTLDSTWTVETIADGLIEANAPDNTRITFWYDQALWGEFGIENAEMINSDQAIIQNYLDTNQAILISGVQNYIAFGGRSYLAVGIRGESRSSPEILVFAFEIDDQILWGLAESLDDDEGQRDRDASWLIGSLSANTE